jgi:two-component system, chemotaxis family, response regulator Rcp1
MAVETDKEKLQESVDVLTEQAKTAAALAKDQRKTADDQSEAAQALHDTARKLEDLSLDLEQGVEALKENLADSGAAQTRPMKTIAESRAIEVLLVEDSPGDVRLTKDTFRDTNEAVNLHIAEDGTEAMAFLLREGTHANAPRPDLILLDLNMPKMDGRQVLASIKAHPDLKTIPTLILTTSSAEGDVEVSYAHNANCFLTKPPQLDAFEELVKNINDFWLTRVSLPQTRH